MPNHVFPAEWPLPDEYLLEFGRMSAVWGSFEVAVNAAISKLAGYTQEPFDVRAVVMVMHSSMQQRIDIVSVLCEQLLPNNPGLADYKGVLAKLRAVQKDRNRFMHGGLYTDAKTGGVGFINASARGTLKTTASRMPLATLKGASVKIHEAIRALQSLIAKKHVKRIWEEAV